MRRRIADLRREAGDPRGAMAMLREAEAGFPEAASALRAPLQAAFLDALRRDPPAEAVALHDARPTLVPSGPEGEAALLDLAERLLALDLPGRAATLLRQAVERQPLGESRAALGARLAQLQLTEGEPAAALAALAASGGGALSLALAERRALLAARAEAQRGRRDVATEMLAALGPAGDETRAEILAEARDFAAAAAALSRRLAALTPAEGPLPEAAERVALRIAALLALAGDERGIAALRRSHGGRMRTASLARGFEALTSDPVRGLADLPRLACELNLFRSFPDLRERLRTAALPTG
ncbi:hypothetical protein [Sabulicella glaciei]|uniref:Tetratricopeptide repeat protein n=1 Tax=Sabulicella glaciei TaxID=2984948 RepID=A0ABT3NT19_9PROT|nr:hypothetical protein [Roseococcus sp. MDT2-1-1]MCW8085300.1 hypothetical protein [Roseococcus sp. MDT2-1-1]